MKISFIIPVYNGSKTIERALKSVLEQEDSNLDFEVLVINDGSTDNTDEIMQKYQGKVKYFKKENGGISDTRNFGISNADGEYVIFVDGDDYVSTTLLKDIENPINKGVDLIKWSPTIVDENGQQLEKQIKNKYIETTGEDGFNVLFGTDPLMDCLWNYAIKKEIIPKFPEGMYHEDFAVMPQIILKAKKMIITDKNEYFYVHTPSSIMRGNDQQKKKKRLEDLLTHFDKMIETTKQMNIKKMTKENVGIFATNSLLVVVPELEKENKEFFVKELKKRKISKYIKARNLKQLIKKVLVFFKYS